MEILGRIFARSSLLQCKLNPRSMPPVATLCQVSSVIGMSRVGALDAFRKPTRSTAYADWLMVFGWVFERAGPGSGSQEKIFGHEQVARKP